MNDFRMYSQLSLQVCQDSLAVKYSNCLYFCLDLNEDGELELLDSDIKDLKRTNMMEESQVIKMKAEMACLEGKVRLGVGVDRGIGVGEVIKMKAEMACLEDKV